MRVKIRYSNNHYFISNKFYGIDLKVNRFSNVYVLKNILIRSNDNNYRILFKNSEYWYKSPYYMNEIIYSNGEIYYNTIGREDNNYSLNNFLVTHHFKKWKNGKSELYYHNDYNTLLWCNLSLDWYNSEINIIRMDNVISFDRVSGMPISIIEWKEDLYNWQRLEYYMKLLNTKESIDASNSFDFTYFDKYEFK